MKDTNIIFEKSNNTESYFSFEINKTEADILSNIPENLLRKDNLKFPSLSENEIIRHYINLSNKNYGVDTGFYPLGSCTMKYNPKINEKISKNPSFIDMHPYS